MNKTKHFYPNLGDRAKIFCEGDRHYQEKMMLLEDVIVGSCSADNSEQAYECLRRDDTYNGIKDPCYIMYKLKPIEHNGLVYEFLVEYQKHDPNTGIYYGCKVSNRNIMEHFENGNIDMANQLTHKMVDCADKEWKTYLRDATALVLSNSYPDKKFNLRFCHTENANDGTYWPFWIRLNEEEDVVYVAANAIKLIKNIYLTHFSDHGLLPYGYAETDDTSSKHVGRKKNSSNTRYFSDAAYEECRILHSIDKNTSFLDEIIRELCSNKTISRCKDIYECAYIINEELSILPYFRNTII